MKIGCPSALGGSARVNDSALTSRSEGFFVGSAIPGLSQNILEISTSNKFDLRCLLGNLLMFSDSIEFWRLFGIVIYMHRFPPISSALFILIRHMQPCVYYM